MNIGNRLRQLRSANDLSLEEVSKRLKITRQTLHKYETGVISNIPSDRIEELAAIYNSSPEYIMGWDARMSDKCMRISVYGSIPAGVPVEAIEDVLDWE